jgi:hypothetical protein
MQICKYMVLCIIRPKILLISPGYNATVLWAGIAGRHDAEPSGSAVVVVAIAEEMRSEKLGTGRKEELASRR